MPKRDDIKKVLVIGSGPIVIGQAAEFDYAGTQACRSLKEEGVCVVLINSNPATIMTDKNIADIVYIEPLTVDMIKKIIIKEKPDSVLPNIGGQAGLNLAMELDEIGFLAEHGVKMIGVVSESIRKAEDRLEFKRTMEKIGEPSVQSEIVTNVDDAVKVADEIGYPVVLRPAYTLGGSGGGIVDNRAQLVETVAVGLRLSRVGQVLVEKSIAGWKEIEYEIMRDCKGNCITVCNMENFDPVGIHTGDSIVVAPSQTLSDKEYQMLRTASFKIINELGIEGGCNVQFSLNPDCFDYTVIEVNPRVSRSSALASKATGYPIAKIAAKIALGYTLDEIQNAITKKTYAAFEPALDYVVVKIPKWPFDKFITMNKKLTTQMKATGEVMSISTSFEAALMKALRSLEQNIWSLKYGNYSDVTNKELEAFIKTADDRRLFALAEAIRRGYTIEKLNEMTRIDVWFLYKIQVLVQMENELKAGPLDRELLLKAKKMGFPDKAIADFCGMTKEAVRKHRKYLEINPAYKIVDTCAAEFQAETPYFYSCYGSANEVVPSSGGRKKAIVFGSGPIRIGQGIEFDYCSVHCVWALKECGYQTIIVNNNPETVSTDFDISDKLYFEPLTEEDVEGIIELEKPDGAVVQFGGQTAIKISQFLGKMGVKILGTSAENVDAAEDRKVFDAILEKYNIPRPAGRTVFTVEEALAAASELGFPVLVRPSYVLGGQGMQIAVSESDIIEFMEIINRDEQEHPVLVDKYLIGKEAEVDAICDGTGILIPGIMEHIERAGIHSGDSISIYPSQTLTQPQIATIVDYTGKIATALNVLGLINIQYIIRDDGIFVIEANPRSSRTVPYISKVTGVPVVEIATKVITGAKIPDLGYSYGLQKDAGYIAIKMPVFSFEKLRGADISLGPQMKSTGEVLGVAKTLNEALYKAFLGAGLKLPDSPTVIITVADHEKTAVIPLAKRLQSMGCEIFATAGTMKALSEKGINVRYVNKISGGSPNILEFIDKRRVHLIVDIPTKGDTKNRDGFLIRRNAVESGVPCMTSLDTLKALIDCLENRSLDALSIVNIAEI